MFDLFEEAAFCLALTDPGAKCAEVTRLHERGLAGEVNFTSNALHEVVPGWPERPVLVPPEQVAFRGMASVEARTALLHAIAHIEFNAINLALDAMCRFPRMPAEFHRGWLKVAAEEAKHFSMVCEHMESAYDCCYGDFPAHGGLWEMAERTAHDPMVRMALIPRLFEARGLDATPAIIRKFQGVGDKKAVAILEVILAEEVGHVALGDFWFKQLCHEHGLEPETTFRELLHSYDAPAPRRPFNQEARRAAGFSESELAAFE